MKRILFRIAAWSLIGLFALVLLGYGIGIWWVGNYLEGDPQFGEVQLKVEKADLSWDLTLNLEGVEVDAPAAQARVDEAFADIELFSSPFFFNPSVKARLGKVDIQLKPTEKPKDTTEFPDSIPFPEFSIPVPVDLSVQSLHLKDSVHLLSVYGFQAGNKDPRKLSASIDSLTSPKTTAKPGLELNVNWEDEQRVFLGLKTGYENDSIQLSASHLKTDLLRGRDTLLIHVASTQPYLKNFDLPDAVPEIQNLDLDITTNLDTLLQAELDLNSTVTGFSDSLPVRLTTQKMGLQFDFDGKRGNFSLKSNGTGNERLKLQGNLDVDGGLSWDSLGNLTQRLAARLQGYVHGIPIKMGEEWKTADVDIENASWSQNKINASIETGDSSFVVADLNKVKGEWHGSFSANVQRTERWVQPFLDTSVVFGGVRVKGSVRGSNLDLWSKVGEIKAYGAMADSLIAWHKIREGRYILDSALLYQQQKPWRLNGYVDYSGLLSLRFQASHREFGSAVFAMPRPSVMIAEANQLHTWKVPYKMVDTLNAYKPIVTANFFWDQKEKNGKVDAEVNGAYKEKEIELILKGNWDPDTLMVENINVRVGSSRLGAEGATLLSGEQFYDFANWTPEQLLRISLMADEFKIGEVAGMFLESPPVQKAILDGELAYSDSLGFNGTYTIQEIDLDATRELFTIKKFRLHGSGKELTFNVVTESKESPFFNDTLLLSVSGILEEKQDVNMKLIVGDSLELGFEGMMQADKGVEGTLNLQGQANLPENSGKLRNLRWRAQVDIPFNNTVDSMRLISDYFHGVYLVPEIQEQYFSAHPDIVSGELKIPDLEIRSSGSDPLTGEVFYPLDGKTQANFHLEGPFLAFNLEGSSIKLSDILINGSLDSVETNLRASIKKIEGTYNDFPLKAEGTITNTSLRANIPKTTARKKDSDSTYYTLDEENLPSIRLNTTMEKSLVRYKLKSIAALKNLFQKKDQGGAPAKPSSGPKPFHINAEIKTSSAENKIDTDILRLQYVADLKVEGTFPYTLINGRINGIDGQFGLEGQAYQIQTAEAKWLNEELENGSLTLRANKELAVDCSTETNDSCTVTTILQGGFNDLQFTYNSNCMGAEGSGANVAALVMSVRRGCYDPSLFTGTGGGYTQGAINLLQPALSGQLTDWANTLTGNWISRVNVTGLSSLVSSDTSVATMEPASLELVTREYKRLRLKVRGGIILNEQELEQPWAMRTALQWRPPLAFLATDPDWRRRLRNNVALEVSLEVDPTEETPSGETEMQRRIGLSYEHGFWNLFGGKIKK